MVIATIGMIVASCGNGYNANVKLSSDRDSFIYAVGVMNGVGFREQLKVLPGFEDRENFDAMITGFAVGASNKVSQLKMTPEEANNYVQQYIIDSQAKEMETTKAESEAFFTANREKAGVITTESGLQYKVITEGTGKKPAAESTVIVHYIGKYLDGTVFESSVEQGEPIELGVSNFIQGWIEVLQLMPVGSKYEVWIPSELAYDPYGPQHPMYGKSLSFEVELLSIKE